MLTVTKVENKALRITDSLKIPVIVATLSDYAHEYTAHEHFLLVSQVATRAVGLVSSCGYWVLGRSSEEQVALIQSLPNQETITTYGDDTGWKMTIQPRTYQNANAACREYIYYQGSEYVNADVYTGYSNFEANLPIIYVDEQNNLIRSSTSAFRGMNYRSETILPLRLKSSRYLITQYNGESLTELGYSSITLYNSNHNMNEDLYDPNDPFDDDDDSDTGGGSGGDNQDNWDGSGDTIPVPGLPDLSAVDTGFITLYNPTTAQLQSLATYLWSGIFDINSFKKIVADPMDVILGLSIVPVDVPASSTAEVKVGNIGTGIYMLKASSQYVEVDCGYIDINEKDHSYLDYSPYTKITLMLPYIGAQEISIDEVNGQRLGLVYHIDVLSGACIAFVTIGGNVVHQYSGQCAVSIPITARDFTQTLQALGQLVAGGLSMAASGGLSAPVSGAMIAGGASSMASGAMNVMNSKPTFQMSGRISGGNGLLAIQKPYVIFERPKKCKPASQQIYTGYPSIMTRQLGSLAGFTQVRDVHLNGIPCTDSERDEILGLMREGIIL